MAKLAKDSLLHGLRATIAKDLILRQVNGETIVSYKTSSNKKKKPSALQQFTRSKFSGATLFAKKITRDPEKKEYYSRLAKKMKLPNAYTAAITEYMRKPSVGDVNVSKSKTGKAFIKINAFKKGFEAEQVKVIACDKNNHEVAYDLVRLKGENFWTGDVGFVSDLSGLSVVAFDRFGNEGKTVKHELPAIRR